MPPEVFKMSFCRACVSCHVSFTEGFCRVTLAWRPGWSAAAGMAAVSEVLPFNLSLGSWSQPGLRIYLISTDDLNLGRSKGSGGFQYFKVYNWTLKALKWKCTNFRYCMFLTLWLYFVLICTFDCRTLWKMCLYYKTVFPSNHWRFFQNKCINQMKRNIFLTIRVKSRAKPCLKNHTEGLTVLTRVKSTVLKMTKRLFSWYY